LLYSSEPNAAILVRRFNLDSCPVEWASSWKAVL